MKFDYDVLIIGGGPAGLSTAMTLGRMSRTALLCDDNHPRNAPSSHVNNFPTHDGIHPADWRKLARKDLEKYQTIQFFQGSVISVEKTDIGFQAKLSSGKKILVKKVVLAYGIKDKLLPIPGFSELWGKAIFHCPFCHGFEIRGSRLGYIANGELAFHALLMIESLASELIVFTNGKSQFTEEQHSILARKNIRLIEEKLERLVHEGETLKAIVLNDGQVVEREYLYYRAEMPFVLKSEIGSLLGCGKTQFGLYQVNERGATTVPGVFACGDNMSTAQSVMLASASGVMAGHGVIAELLQNE